MKASDEDMTAKSWPETKWIKYAVNAGNLPVDRTHYHYDYVDFLKLCYQKLHNSIKKPSMECDTGPIIRNEIILPVTRQNY